jgi:hypothetical protein
MAAGRVSRSWVANGSCPSGFVFFLFNKNDPQNHTNKGFRFVCFRGSPYLASQALKINLLICRECAGPLP